MNNKMSIIAFSGTEDKLMAAAIIASGAVANDLEVQLGINISTKIEMLRFLIFKKTGYSGKFY